MTQQQHQNQIDYIELPARDITATKQFYGTVFGWKFEDYGPDYTAYFDGRLAGGFTKEVQPTGRGPLPVIYASDLAAAIKKIEAAGGKIVKNIFSFPGGRRFHFADPNGNELAVWSDIDS